MNPTEQKILILIVIFAVSATVIPFASDPLSIGSAQNYLCGINIIGSNLITCTQPNDNFTFTHGSGIQMKSFQANKTIWLNATVSGGSGGEVNTASNLAGTLNWFTSKVGVDLPFRGLNLGSGLTGSQDANTVTLDTKLRINNGTCPVGYVMNGQNNVTGARNCVLDTSGTGTYSKVLANNVQINSGGAGLNFLNDTNNPLHIVNDPTRNQVNITVNIPSSTDSDPAPKVSINNQNRSQFINIMQTNSSVISDLTDVAGGGTTGQVLTKASNGTWIAQNNVHGVTSGAGTSVNGTTGTVSVSANVHAVQAGTGVSVNGTTGTVVVSSTASGTATLLSSNQTCTSTSNFCHIWTISLTANTGNAISGVLIASTNTAGGAVQVGANMSSIAHGQGSCLFSYASAGTTLTTFSSVLTATSSDSAWTTILAGANQPYPINFYCTVDTDGSPPSLQINFQAEVASTVSIKANSFYQKTP